MEHNRKNSKVLYMLLALAISMVIWFYVDSYGNNGSAFPAQQEITDIPIEYTGKSSLASRGLVLSEEGTSASVDLTYEGARLLVSQLDRSRIRITADLSGITEPGVQSVRYTSTFLDSNRNPSRTAIQTFSRVSRISQSIDTATVRISELSRKEVDVRCELVGSVADGYQAGQIQLSQKTIELQGAEEDLANVSYAKVTLDLGDGAEETVSQTLTCQFYDTNDEPVETDNFYLSTDQVQATLPVYVTRDLELKIDFTEAAGARLKNTNWDLQPASVTVSGEASKLRGIYSITLDELNLADLVGSGNAVYHYFIVVPEGCENQSGISRATLQIAFKDMTSAVVTATQFSVGTELPEGKTAEILTESLNVSIFGTAADVGAVTSADILVTPDLSDVTGAGGTLTVPAQFTILNARDVGISDDDYQLQVRIQERGDTQ